MSSNPAQPAAGDMTPAEYVKAMDALSEPSFWFEAFNAYPQWVINLLCRLRTVHNWIPGWSLVLGHEEVREALSRDAIFPVGWGGKMEEVTKGEGKEGANFVLGMENDDHYKASYKQLAECFPLKDLTEHITTATAKRAGEILASKEPGKPFDAAQDLMLAIPAGLCRTYFGLRFDEKDDVLFAKWSLGPSSYTFAIPGETPPPKKAVSDEGAWHLRRIIRDSMAAANTIDLKTPMDRMMKKGLPEKQVMAQFFGMVLGFIPTDVLAGGNILETLLRYPKFLERARAAAVAGDDDLLWRCLREALRFRHINPGMWRYCPEGHTFASGRKTPAGKKVFIGYQSAMFDARRIERPHVFDPDRCDEDYVTFGVGQHWCIGAYIAREQITQTFKPLVKLRGLRAVGHGRATARRFSDIFPISLPVVFDK
ncbi:cytochrome P450 [Usitatibacter palustris]|uniref:cytochrome P450 n=1 Tax=Usitatibacter palustris TaxID=2732487 RepID=UPI00148973D4|nr:cytochrome P450 [Usitatibacter palustris]